MGNIGTWQLVIVAIVILVLFGAKRLPEAARGLGRSLKIFKSETQGLINEEKAEDKGAAAETPAPPQAPRAVEPQSAPEQATQPAADQPRREV